MSRRVKSLHHNIADGTNIVFHREHRSKKGRKKDAKYKHVMAGAKKEHTDRVIDRLTKTKLRNIVRANQVYTHV